MSTTLENRVFAIKHVFLSHGHADHISGLMGLINIRNNAMGDHEKELRVYYPAGSPFVSELIRYFARTNRNLQYDLEWIPLQAGDRVVLLEGRMPRYIAAFGTVHARGSRPWGTTCARSGGGCGPLPRPPQEEIVALVRAGKKDEISEEYTQILFSYGGTPFP